MQTMPACTEHRDRAHQCELLRGSFDGISLGLPSAMHALHNTDGTWLRVIRRMTALVLVIKVASMRAAV